jgi:hypothetical protein
VDGGAGAGTGGGGGSTTATATGRPRRLTLIAAAVLQDVLLHYGASKYGTGPPALGRRSPRNSFNPEADNFARERGSYQQVFEAP